MKYEKRTDENNSHSDDEPVVERVERAEHRRILQQERSWAGRGERVEKRFQKQGRGIHWEHDSALLIRRPAREVLLEWSHGECPLLQGADAVDGFPRRRNRGDAGNPALDRKLSNLRLVQLRPRPLGVFITSCMRPSIMRSRMLGLPCLIF